MTAYLLLGIAILTNVAGHVAFKQGALAGVGGALLGSFLNLPVAAGLAAYGASAFFYIASLRQLPLSVAMPSMALGYLGTALVAHWLWGEAFGGRQLAALALVGGGLFLLHR
jgi:multidrug transporter EmrE-like cation transporter